MRRNERCCNKANLDELGSLTNYLLTAERVLNSVYVHTLYQISLAPARKPYRIGLLFTHKNGDCEAISIIERSRADLIRGESQIG